MATPKSLLFQLHRYWEVVETLVRWSRDLPVFELDQVLQAIRPHHAEEPEAVLRSLLSADILQTISRSDALQLNPAVLNFARSLTKEHELGLSAVLRARVEAIKNVNHKLNQAMQLKDHDAMRRAAAQLSDLFRQIAEQLEQDRHAIMDIAEKAKASDASMPIEKRYQEVLEAYDQYVEPMNEMMDSGLGGVFYPHLEAAQKSLDRANEQLATQGGLYSHRLQLRQVAYQAKDLRRTGRLVALQCAEQLLPLREEARKHNALSSSISYLLGQVRKKGLRRALHSDMHELPVWRADRQRRVTVGSEVLTIMAEAMNYTPRVNDFPEEQKADEAVLEQTVDYDALLVHLRGSLPVDNLLHWLCEYSPHLLDHEVLRLYHELIREPEWFACIGEQEALTELKEIRVRYHPHKVEAHES